MRNALIVIGACGSLVAILTACGGGGSSSTPATVTASPLAVASVNPNQSVNNVAGPTGTMTLTFAIPKMTEPDPTLRARIKARYGSKLTDAHIRTMANTSPTAQIRAVGLQQNRYAQAVEASTKRNPEFVSGATQYAELVLTQGSTVAFDGTVSCPETSNTCTGTFQVPSGNGYTLSLYLYDDCEYLLSVGTLSNVNVAVGSNSPVTVTLNGVASYVDVTTSATTPFVATPSGAQSSFSLNVAPLDADDQVITTPGILLDESLKQVSSFNVTLDSTYSDVTPTATQSLAVNAALTVAAGTYNYTATGSEMSVVWDVTPVEIGSPITSAAACGPFCDGVYAPSDGSGQLSVMVTQPSLQWTSQSSGYQLTDVSTGQSSSETAEFPAPVAASFMFGLSESIGYTGNITLSDNGNCSGVVYQYTPGLATPAPYTALSVSPYVQIHLAYPQPSSNNCIVTATDGNGLTANLTLLIDSSSLTIQSSARKH